MLIFQMFPPVLSLVAIYALFDQLGKHAGWLGVNSHGAVIVASHPACGRAKLRATEVVFSAGRHLRT